jgi:hypothetical protein
MLYWEGRQANAAACKQQLKRSADGWPPGEERRTRWKTTISIFASMKLRKAWKEYQQTGSFTV